MATVKSREALCTSQSFRHSFGRPIAEVLGYRRSARGRGPNPSRVAIDRERLEAIGEQLIAKIRSKFTAVTLMAGFALSVLILEIATLWEDPFVPATLPFSVGATAFALGMFMIALVKLDALTMPKRYWEETEQEEGENDATERDASERDANEKIALATAQESDSVSTETTNPPARAAFYTEEDLWSIYTRMVFYWSYGALAATVITGIAAVSLLYPAPLNSVIWARLPAWCATSVAAAGTVVMYWLMVFGACVLSDNLHRVHD